MVAKVFPGDTVMIVFLLAFDENDFAADNYHNVSSLVPLVSWLIVCRTDMQQEVLDVIES